MMNWYLKVLREYANFSGRARRKEYWMFLLFQMIFALTAAVIDNVLGTTFKIEEVTIPYGYVYVIYTLALLIPGLAVCVRRIHDVGKSGWFLLIILIPIIGTIWLLVLLCKDSESGENQYGPNPKEQEYLEESAEPLI